MRAQALHERRKGVRAFAQQFDKPRLPRPHLFVVEHRPLPDRAPAKSAMRRPSRRKLIPRRGKAWGRPLWFESFVRPKPKRLPKPLPWHRAAVTRAAAE